MPDVRRIAEFSLIGELYHQRMKKDFARNELRPLSIIRRSWDSGEYVCYGLYEEATLIGYAFFVRNERKHYLFDYFAIDEEYRNRGYDSLFLQQLSIPDAECIIGEVEDPEKAADKADRAKRERRMQFYLRNGVRKTGVTACVFGVDYRILEVPTGKDHDDKTIAEFYDSIYRSTLPAKFYLLNFKIT